MDKNVEEKVTALAKEGKLPCKKALALADELGVSPSVVGKAANENSIKIVGCQLGCFG